MSKTTVFVCILLAFLLLLGCTQSDPGAPKQQTFKKISRLDTIPSVKITPEMDIYPPQLHSDEWETPVPLGAPVNTAGAEDSPFITPDGNTLYFFFTPDPNIPAEKQLFDGVTGIWVSKKQNGKWGEPERVVLQDAGKLSLDGCEFVQGNKIWFCSVREGYEGINWFTAELKNGKWQDWKENKFNDGYAVGELHITGNELYYHSSRKGGNGGLDIWVTKNVDGNWQEPINLVQLNTPENEGWPFISQDGKELWFLRTYLGSPALFRSKNLDGQWQTPKLIVSQFAGEPTLDNEGNLYFVHHFYKDGKMLEADIYVAYKK